MFFYEVLSKEDLKSQYKRLAKVHHPDLGGTTTNMQIVNREFEVLNLAFGQTPKSLYDVRLGNKIYVNDSECIVTAIESKLFKVRSLVTKREGYFEKSTGLGLFNFKFRVRCSN